VPQLAQNFDPACTGVWQFLQGCGTRDCPQLLQNFDPACTSARQLGHEEVGAFDDACCAPQLEQNFTPTAF
jgi:hypothetical protein